MSKVISNSVFPSVEPLCYEIFVTAQGQWPNMPTAVPGIALPHSIPDAESQVPR